MLKIKEGDSFYKFRSTEEAITFLKLLEEKGATWASGHKPLQKKKYFEDLNNAIRVSTFRGRYILSYAPITYFESKYTVETFIPQLKLKRRIK